MADRQVALPLAVGRILGGKTRTYSQSLFVSCQRASQIALRAPHVADLIVTDGQVALPLAVRRILRYEARANRPSLFIGRQRACQVVLCPPCVAYPLMAD